MTQTDIKMMQLALDEAKKAALIGEVPVGCVVVCEGEIVSSAYNLREQAKNALAHAELLAIEKACKKLGGWRLHRCELYVTLEPCPMCMGAIINSRIRRVIFGARDPKAGCLGSVVNLNEMAFNHHPEVEAGIMQEECAEVLQIFFKQLRNERKI